MSRPTTGIRPLDDLIGGLRLGDNVIWEAEEGARLDEFVTAFVRGYSGRPLVYVSFHVSPATTLTRLRDVWNADHCILVDCFTDGLGQGEDTYAAFYRSRRARRARVHRVSNPGDAEVAQATLAGIERDLGRGAGYVFDSLTGMQELWGADAALSFFIRSCPRLYDLRTVAYWLLARHAHDSSFLSQLAHVTQLVLELHAEEEGQSIRVLKAEGRPGEVWGRRAHLDFDGERVRMRRDTAGPRARLGDMLREQRLARGLSQAELGARIGISASAVSQAERGRAGLSGHTLARAWEVLGVPFGPGLAERQAYELSRRGARPSEALGPGLLGEEVAETPSGGRAYLLTFAPGSSGRRPPFATKHPEVAFVVSGLLELRVGNGVEALRSGDAIQLASEPIAGWRNPGPEETKVIWLVLP